MSNIETKVLICNLTNEELVAKGEEIVALYRTNSELDMQKKRLSASIKRNDEDIEKLLNIVDTKQEERDVDCVWVWFWDLGYKKLVRLDTDTVAESTIIRDWERQGKLELEPGGEPDEVYERAFKVAVSSGDALSEEGPPEDEPDNNEPRQAPDILDLEHCPNTECPNHDKTENNFCTTWEQIHECDTLVTWLKDAYSTDAAINAIDAQSARHQVELDSDYFRDNGPLKKAFPSMAGVPEDGKLKKIFTHNDQPYYLVGASFDSNGYKDVDAYELIKRDEWIGETSTVKDRVAAYYKQRPMSGVLSRVGCIVVHKSVVYILANYITFVHASKEVEKPEVTAESPTLIELCKSCHTDSECGNCCKTCPEKCSNEMNCRWPGAEVEAC